MTPAWLREDEVPDCKDEGCPWYGEQHGHRVRVTSDTTSDNIHHPPHYNVSAIEPIAVIEAWNLGFCLGNVVKYIARAEHKGSTLDDLKKARWYLDREIKRRSSDG